MAFPDRIRCVYLSGSYANAGSVRTSDIDGLVVFKDRPEQGEANRFSDLAQVCSLLSGMVVDLAPRGEADLFDEGELPAKSASRILLCGDDIRPALPAMPL